MPTPEEQNLAGTLSSIFGPPEEAARREGTKLHLGAKPELGPLNKLEAEFAHWKKVRAAGGEVDWDRVLKLEKHLRAQEFDIGMAGAARRPHQPDVRGVTPGVRTPKPAPKVVPKGRLDFLKGMSGRNKLLAGAGIGAAVLLGGAIFGDPEEPKPVPGMPTGVLGAAEATQGIGTAMRSQADSAIAVNKYGRGSKIVSPELMEQVLQDRKMDQKEWAALVKQTKMAQDNDAALQLLEERSARKVLDEEVWWRDPGSLWKVKALMTERETLGSFGSYHPDKNVLRVGGFVDPNMLINQGYRYFGDVESEAQSSRLAQGLTGWITPNRVRETTLHEGLHAVWDIDIDPKHKETYIKEAHRQMSQEEWSEDQDVLHLAVKAPVYAEMIVTGKHLLDWGMEERAKPYVEWAANEMFAHRGAGLMYKNLGYQLPKNKELEDIARKYVKWGKGRHESVTPAVKIQDYATPTLQTIGEEGFEKAEDKAGDRMLPEDFAVQFNKIGGLHPGSQGLGAQMIQPPNSDFGSGWVGGLGRFGFRFIRSKWDAESAQGFNASSSPLASAPSTEVKSQVKRMHYTNEARKLSRANAVRRNRRFRKNSQRAVGIGFRAAHNASRGHTAFNSTVSG